MTFRAIRRTDPATGYSPFRVVDEQGRELEWLNRFLDMQVRARPGAPHLAFVCPQAAALSCAGGRAVPVST
jgi:hypothetical protein